ncbi:MAG: DUF2271 domain-containing protein [Planctomycetota bacterium]
MRFLFAFTLILLTTLARGTETYRFHHENVLGTSLELVVRADTERAAIEFEKLALAEIDRLDAVLSRHRDDSELMQWQSTGTAEVSADLAGVLRVADRVRDETGGAFDVRAEAIRELWANGLGVSDASRRELADKLRLRPYRISGNQVARTDGLPISLDGVAKGYVIDRVCECSRGIADIAGVLVNIGGDVRATGDLGGRVGVEDPRLPAIAASALERVEVKGSAIATSGGYRRQVKTPDTSVSHLFDPRTCLPVTGVSSVSVIAPTAAEADAYATAFSAMSATGALAFAETRDSVECLIVDAMGSIERSSGWPAPVQSTTLVADAKGAEAKDGLHVWFKLNRPEGRRYRRPYVAVWLEDKDGFPVKTSVLWIQTDQPGPRWHRDLTRWFRNDRMRLLVEDESLIDTVSGATRGPGDYEAHFDGTDNSGSPLAPGTYTLCIEAAREHGTYKIIRKKFDWGTASIKRTDLKGNLEVSEASFEFRPGEQSSEG